MTNNHYGSIYKITNKTNNKSYIGQSAQKNIYRRLRKYKTLQCQSQPKIYNALKKYGPNNFTYDIIDHANDQTQLDLLEDSYIVRFDAIDNGYNCKEGGAHGKFSRESLTRLSEALMGHECTEETKRKISEANKGKHFGLGRRVSEETKQRMSMAQKTRFQSMDERRKYSESLKGRVFSDETKARMKAAAIARYSKIKVEPSKFCDILTA